MCQKIKKLLKISAPYILWVLLCILIYVCAWKILLCLTPLIIFFCRNTITEYFTRLGFIFRKQYDLRYEACLEAFRLIDAHLSHILLDPERKPPPKQYATTEEARTCHYKLILTCVYSETIEAFNDLMFRSENETRPYTDILNEFRNLVRKELGFGIIKLDREKAWFAKFAAENSN
jgi:hypothetical protein